MFGVRISSSTKCSNWPPKAQADTHCARSYVQFESCNTARNCEIYSPAALRLPGWQRSVASIHHRLGGTGISQLLSAGYKACFTKIRSRTSEQAAGCEAY